MGRLKVWKMVLLGLMTAGWMLGFAPGTALSADRERADGVLAAIENDGGVVAVLIDDKGFFLDPAVKILNRLGERISLSRLSPPVRVFYEFEYTKQGAVIKLIEEYQIRE